MSNNSFCAFHNDQNDPAIYTSIFSHLILLQIIWMSKLHVSAIPLNNIKTFWSPNFFLDWIFFHHSCPSCCQWPSSLSSIWTQSWAKWMLTPPLRTTTSRSFKSPFGHWSKLQWPNFKTRRGKREREREREKRREEKRREEKRREKGKGGREYRRRIVSNVTGVALRNATRLHCLPRCGSPWHLARSVRNRRVSAVLQKKHNLQSISMGPC